MTKEKILRRMLGWIVDGKRRRKFKEQKMDSVICDAIKITWLSEFVNTYPASQSTAMNNSCLHLPAKQEICINYFQPILLQIYFTLFLFNIYLRLYN